ncbi:DUF1015 domain-containing protein [Clostridium sediminicola]|uniref:DUF1015 domain-containing protein n=1 Tax=Clostridium sediminicola TaxID=3114879 RepID=UPI0031F1FFE4
MVYVKGFKAIRPKKDLANKVAALPYDVMSSSEARKMVEGNPYSFLHVDRAEIDLDEDTNIYDKKVYEKARENLYNMLNNDVLIQDSKECLYIYRLIMNGRIQTGLVVAASIDDYLNNKIKKHEYTREEKERDRINHVDYCDANTGPIFLTYKKNDRVSSIIEEWTNNYKPEYDFVAQDGITHMVWVINDSDKVNELLELYKDLDSLYIADGHHRCASAAKVALMRRRENPDYLGMEPFNYFLSVVFPDEELNIMDYNRVVKDLNGLTDLGFLKRVKESFFVEEYKNIGCFKPEERNSFGMYLNNKWYVLRAKDTIVNNDDLVERLDVSILQNYLLDPILGIKDPRKDDRIDFVGGIRGLEELEKRVEDGMKVAFSMYPTSIKELMDIADNDKVMPPKSTWFEPKLRSGLFVHKLK